MKRLLVVEDKADNLRHIAHALRLFVGRELRMAELKKRIRELEGKNGIIDTEKTTPRRD